MEAIQQALKQLIYNPDNQRVMPNSPYWSMQDASRQASTMRPNSQPYYDALTAPMGNMVMAATAGPKEASQIGNTAKIRPMLFAPDKQNDALGNSLKNYLNDDMGNSLRDYIRQAASAVAKTKK